MYYRQKDSANTRRFISLQLINSHYLKLHLKLQLIERLWMTFITEKKTVIKGIGQRIKIDKKTIAQMRTDKDSKQ